MKLIFIGCLVLAYVTSFSLGDELGFAESLGNLEGNKRRSLSDRESANINAIGVLPASKLPPTQIPPQQQQRSYQQTQPVQTNRPHALTVRNQQPISHPQLPMSTTINSGKNTPIPSTTIYKKSNAIAMTEAMSLPLGVPAFRRIPSSVIEESKKVVANNNSNNQNNGGQQQQQQSSAQNTFNRKVSNYEYPSQGVINQLNNLTYAQPFRTRPTPSVVQKIPKQQQQQQGSSPSDNTMNVPAFQAMPSSVSRISTGQIVQLDDNNEILTRDTIYQNNNNNNNNNVKREGIIYENSNLISGKNLPEVDLRGHTVEELALVANVSVETIQNAIKMRQKQLLVEQQTALYRQQLDMIMKTSTIPTITRSPTRPPKRPTTTTTTTTTTTPPPPPPTKPIISGGSKVMNAPKEYYPVGYDKNFDDNFMSKVDLPPTSFHCGDQKHFPGLYADTDLGCMVFHVCALTDDGLIMKSFLCPESTLFDQTVLKCNWWFYVDCKGSKNLYDSNLPVSKSYQLMKALTFFSNYKNTNNEKDGVDVEALKNSVAQNKQQLSPS